MNWHKVFFSVLLIYQPWKFVGSCHSKMNGNFLCFTTSFLSFFFLKSHPKKSSQPKGRQVKTKRNCFNYCKIRKEFQNLLWEFDIDWLLLAPPPMVLLSFWESVRLPLLHKILSQHSPGILIFLQLKGRDENFAHLKYLTKFTTEKTLIIYV